MKIAAPPLLLPGARINLYKQWEVASAVYDPVFDTVLRPRLAAKEELLRAHQADYVHEVLAGMQPNGFGTTEPAVLEHALLSVGSMISACQAATPREPVFTPVSGFHHAGYAQGGGYCTFNGLVIGAVTLRVEGRAPNRIVVLDGDGHWGDGTDEIIRVLGLGSWLKNYSMRDMSQMELTSIFAQSPDLVIYQAGADAHIEDPYGVGYLTDAQWHERDKMVFYLARTHRVPLVWNLAGGYNGDKTIWLHTSTFESAVREYEPGQTRLPSAPDALSNTIAGLGIRV